MDRKVFDFSYPQAEALHWAKATEVFNDLLTHAAYLMIQANEGFSYFGSLPTFDKRDKRTLQAALISRSFNAASCAIHLAVKGYYVPAITLTRSILEDDWILWETDQSADAVNNLYGGKWPRGRRFGDIVNDLDAWLSGMQGSTMPSGAYAAQMGSRGAYGDMSEIAHPRSQGLRLQFDRSGTRLKTGPEWEVDFCKTALLYCANAASSVLNSILTFVPVAPESQQWRSKSDGVRSDFVKWLEAQANQ